jgi:hypothetical protein
MMMMMIGYYKKGSARPKTSNIKTSHKSGLGIGLFYSRRGERFRDYDCHTLLQGQSLDLTLPSLLCRLALEPHVVSLSLRTLVCLIASPLPPSRVCVCVCVQGVQIPCSCKSSLSGPPTRRRMVRVPAQTAEKTAVSSPLVLHWLISGKRREG